MGCMTGEVFRNALVLTGPTGSGKSSLALDFAERLDAEIVSMDSMALYRHMDVGTAKPTAADRSRVPHHLVDVLDPWESGNVAWWLRQAAAACQDIEARGRRVLFVGGTPLYLKSLLYGLFDGPPADPALRERLTREADERGPVVLHSRLAAADPASAARLHPNDVRRVVRALEVWELTGKPLSAWQSEWEAPAPATAERMPRCLWLERDRPDLYARIDARVRQMFAGGLVAEAQALRALGHPLSREAGKALGYREVFEHLDGRAGLEETVALVQTRTRQLARRQLTWFRALPACLAVREELTFTAWGLRIDQGRMMHPSSRE